MLDDGMYGGGTLTVPTYRFLHLFSMSEGDEAVNLDRINPSRASGSEIIRQAATLSGRSDSSRCSQEAR